MRVTSHAAWQARCLLQVSSSDQLRRNVRSCPARRRSHSHLTSSSANAHSASFAATVSPDVAKESASSNKSYEHSNNKATTQQSTGASHIKPCYPEKTINCSDGVLDLAVFHLTLIAHMLLLTAVSLIAEEWKARVDLAAIYRICHNLGLNEGINNHLTATIPTMPGHFLVFPFGLLWSEVTASNLLLMDNKVCCAAVSPMLPLIRSCSCVLPGVGSTALPYIYCLHTVPCYNFALVFRQATHYATRQWFF